MRRISLAVAAITIVSIASFGAGTASAADMPVKAYGPVAHTYSWTGFYVGGHFGGAWGNTKWFEDATLTGGGGPFAGFQDGAYNMSGVLGGGQLGFNYQTGWTVWGIEADLSGASITGSTASGACFPQAGGNQSCSTRINWLGTVTGRVGAAFDRTLVYVKGGYVWAHEKHENPAPGFGATWTASETRGGWTIGGGVEYAWTAPWSLKLEYGYVEFGTRNVGTFLTQFGTVPYTEDIRQNLHVVKLGINYRFGGPVR